MSLFILFLLFTALVGGSLILHYSFDMMKILPDPSQVTMSDSDYFKFNYTFYLNILFLILSGFFVYFGFFKHKDVKYMKEMAPKSQLFESVLKYLALVCYVWLLGGILINYIIL